MPEVLRTAERAMGIAERLGNEVLWANAAVLYGNGMTWAGRGEEAGTHVDAAWEIGDRLNHPWVPFLATWCWQGDLCWRGEVARAACASASSPSRGRCRRPASATTSRT